MNLQLHSDYLSGKPVRVGDVIEVLVNGQWTKVQYSWSGVLDCDAFGVIDIDQTTVTITRHTHARWPLLQTKHFDGNGDPSAADLVTDLGAQEFFDEVD
jgi:hypothetical protein